MISYETPVGRLYAQSNRGYYSEDIVVGYRRLDVGTERPPTALERRIASTQSIVVRMFNNRYATMLTAIPEPAAPPQPRLLPPMRWKQFRTRVPVSFPIQTIQPKVQVLAVQAVGLLPRDVEVERRMRRFAKQSLVDLMAEADVPAWQLVPVHILSRDADMQPEETDAYNSLYSRLPLEWFDDFDADSQTPPDWLHMGQLPGERHPLPADAFLPRNFFSDITDESVEHTVRMSIQSQARQSSMSRQYTEAEAEALRKQLLRAQLFTWVRCSVHQYNERTRRWLVTDLESGRHYTIPRIYLRFLAEDGRLFVERVRGALRRRHQADLQFKFGLIADSMIRTGVPGPTVRQMQLIFRLSEHYKRPVDDRQMTNVEVDALRRHKARMAEAQRGLADEVALDYQRTQAALELRETVQRLDVEAFVGIEYPDRR